MGDKCCEDEKCECEDDGCECGSECGCGDECSSEASMAKMMMGLANEAWAELMREKMKAAYEKKRGAKMNKAAEIAVDACIALWDGKMEQAASWKEFEETLKEAMK